MQNNLMKLIENLTCFTTLSTHVFDVIANLAPSRGIHLPDLIRPISRPVLCSKTVWESQAINTVTLNSLLLEFALPTRHLQLCGCHVPHGNFAQNFKEKHWIQRCIKTVAPPPLPPCPLAPPCRRHCIKIDWIFTSDVLQWKRWIAPTLSEEYLVEKTNKFSTNGWDVIHAERLMLSSAYSSMSS